VQLKQILNDNVYAKVQAATLKADTQDYFTESVTPPHGTGVRGDWFVQGSPVSQRYLRLSDKPTSDLILFTGGFFVFFSLQVDSASSTLYCCIWRVRSLTGGFCMFFPY
jgi:hypothetical protein